MRLSNSRLTGSRKDKRNKRAFLHHLFKDVETAFGAALTTWTKDKARSLGFAPEVVEALSKDGALYGFTLEVEPEVERRGGLIVVRGPAVSHTVLRRDALMEVEA